MFTFSLIMFQQDDVTLMSAWREFVLSTDEPLTEEHNSNVEENTLERYKDL
jgi:hypothetical protein